MGDSNVLDNAQSDQRDRQYFCRDVDLPMGTFECEPKGQKRFLSKRTIGVLVDSVVTGQFDFPPIENTWQQDDSYNPVTDPWRPCRDVATDFVNEQFFKNENSLYYFLKLVIDAHESAIAAYCRQTQTDPSKVVFLFKGGNAMRIVSKEFLLNVPAYVRKSLQAHYGEYFKRSDADFTIAIERTQPNYERILRDMQLITYRLQVQLRNAFLADLCYYFDFFQTSAEVRQRILRAYFDRMSAAECSIQPLTSLAFAGTCVPKACAPKKSRAADPHSLESDFYMRPQGEMGTVGYGTYPNTGENFLRISHNDALKFGDSGEIEFVLVRTKIIMNAASSESNKVVSGELIDVSIGKDAQVDHLFAHIDKYVQEYTLGIGPLKEELTATGVPTLVGCFLKFKSLSVAYMVDDLLNILFVQNRYPWADKKYQKRIKRVLFMCFVDLLTTGDSQILDTFIKFFKYYLRQIDSPSRNNEEKLQKTIANLNGSHFQTLAQKLAIMIQHPMPTAPTERAEFDVDLATLLETIQTELEFLASVHNQIENHCRLKGASIDESAIFKSSVESLV